MTINSKLPHVGTTIFTVMSALATEHNAINLSQGFPNFNPSEALQRFVFEAMQAGNNQYSPMPGILSLREKIALKMERLYGAKLDPETEITITAGGTQAIFCAIGAFVHPGDEVILIEPCYDSYRPSVETVGGIAIPYVLNAPDYQIDWKEVAKQISPKTRMLCINTPNNPTGTLLKEADMLAIQQMLDGTNIILLSDEVYEHLIFDGENHASVLRFPKLFARTLAIYSFGKTYHNTGWKTGYIIAPEALTKECRKVHQFNVFSANHPLQHAFSKIMEDPNQYDNLPDFYQNKRDFFLEAMKNTRLKPLKCSGTYFQLFDYSSITEEMDLDFCKRLTKEYGVAAIPVSAFYSNQKDEKVIRLCFAKTDDLLLEAGKRLEKL